MHPLQTDKRRTTDRRQLVP